MKFCVVVDIIDVVTHTNFGDHRLSGFWRAGVKFSPCEPVINVPRRDRAAKSVSICSATSRLVSRSFVGVVTVRIGVEPGRRAGTPGPLTIQRLPDQVVDGPESTLRLLLQPLRLMSGGGLL